MIINTGMRTDIPGFFSEWFCNRLVEGSVCVKNPYYPKNITRYRLDPEVVDVLAFCTKNPGPMISHLDLLEPFKQFWFVTITPYGKDIEPGVPDKNKVIEDFKILSRKLGMQSVGWRYDPIFLDNVYTKQLHLTCFEEMAAKLEGYTDQVIISFVDLFEKVKRNFPEVREVSKEERLELGEAMTCIARNHGMVLKPCGEGDDLAPFGADCSGCMTLPVYERACGYGLKSPVKKSGRKECACLLVSDIGHYDTCSHFCRYCYANNDMDAVKRNRAHHDPRSSLLVGHIMADDNVVDAVQESWRDEQGRLF